jgi:enamine deaminase RidA (YjgF/YER057c/UK114 family)
MMSSAMRLKRYPRQHFTECHMTFVGRAAASVADVARDLFGEVCDALGSHGILPVRERVIGPGRGTAEILSVRREVLAARGLDASRPCTVLSRRPEEDSEPPAVQVWGVQPHGEQHVEVETVALGDRRSGRLLTTPGLRLLWMSGITGADGGAGLAASAVEQAQLMFERAAAGLERHGFAYTDVVRTWIALRRILDWYADFNAVRTSFHARQGFMRGPGSRAVPASTGIQGWAGDEECLMDVLAIQSTGPTDVVPLRRSARQDEPSRYGSGFSRGMALACGGVRTVLVSGTASIGANGSSLHVGDPEAQAVETLDNVAALLEPLGGTLDDICGGTLYYKDLAARAAFARASLAFGIADLPLVPVMADICRPELLVEIEAEAVIARSAEVGP